MNKMNKMLRKEGGLWSNLKICLCLKLERHSPTDLSFQSFTLKLMKTFCHQVFKVAKSFFLMCACCCLQKICFCTRVMCIYENASCILYIGHCFHYFTCGHTHVSMVVWVGGCVSPTCILLPLSDPSCELQASCPRCRLRWPSIMD